jgi:hypothetical protein
MVWLMAIVLWPILGFVAFRIMVHMSDGIKRETGAMGQNKIYYKPLDGVKYMLMGGLAFLGVFMLMCLYTLYSVCEAIAGFLSNLNSDYNANKFFGTGKERS